MRKIYAILLAVLVSASVFAQAPDMMSYQAIVRNASNNLVTNTTVGMQISILQGSLTGTAVYVETQTPETNANGMLSIEIGTGELVSGSFATIDWANGPYYIKTETDPAGGTNYTITGTSQLLSVPYALHAKTAESISGGITETDPVFVASAAQGITSTNVSNWNTSYGWGNHASAGYLTTYTETDPLFSNFFSISSPANEQLLRYNSTSGKWENYTPSGLGSETDPIFAASAANGITSTNVSNWNTSYGWGNHASAGYLTSYTETDPAWTTASASYYTKTNLQTSGGAQLHFDNITSKPTTLLGYGITDAMSTSHAANVITSTNISNWSTAYGWGNHASAGYLTSYTETDPIFSGKFSIATAVNNQLLKYNSTSSKWENWTPNYLTAEVDGSITNEIELPTQTGNSGKYLTTNGTSPSWVTIDKSTVGLGNVENTALSTWAGTANITTLGTIATGTWQGTAINASYVDVLPTSKITSGTFDNARINWAAPGTIGSTTASSGAFTSLSASNGLSVSNGTVNIKPSGSGGTSGQVLTTDGSGAATWQTPTAASRSVRTITTSTTLTTTDEVVFVNAVCVVTLPATPANGQVLMICCTNDEASIDPNGHTLNAANDGSPVPPLSLTFAYLPYYIMLIYDSNRGYWWYK